MGSGIIKIKTGLKLGGLAADEFFADVAWRPVNSNMQTDVIAERPLAWLDEGERAEAMSLGELSVGELLYYVLRGDGRIADEPT